VVGEGVGGAEGFELVESRNVVLGLRIVATWRRREEAISEREEKLGGWWELEDSPATTSRSLEKVSSSTSPSLVRRAKDSMARATFFLPSNRFSEMIVGTSLSSKRREGGISFARVNEFEEERKKTRRTHDLTILTSILFSSFSLRGT